MSIASLRLTPAMRITLPTHRSVNAPDPARNGVPGTTTLPLACTSHWPVAARRQPCQTARVARNDRSCRRLRADDGLHDRRRQVVPVGNKTRPKFVGGQLLPDVVLVPRQHRVRAVAQMRAQLRRRRRLRRESAPGLLPCVRWRRRTPVRTACSMNFVAPGRSGASVTSRMRPPAASCQRWNSAKLGSRICSFGCAPTRPIVAADVRAFDMKCPVRPQRQPDRIHMLAAASRARGRLPRTNW